MAGCQLLDATVQPETWASGVVGYASGGLRRARSGSRSFLVLLDSWSQNTTPVIQGIINGIPIIMFIVAGVALGRFGGFRPSRIVGLRCSRVRLLYCLYCFLRNGACIPFQQRARHQPNIFAFNGTWHDESADTIPRVVLRAFNLGTEHRSGVAKNVGWLAHWTVAICRG